MTDMPPEIVADELKRQLLPVPLAARPILLEAITNLIATHGRRQESPCARGTVQSK